MERKRNLVLNLLILNSLLTWWEWTKIEIQRIDFPDGIWGSIKIKKLELRLTKSSFWNQEPDNTCSYCTAILQVFHCSVGGNQAQIWWYLETPQSKFQRDACQNGTDENVPNVNKNKAPKKCGEKGLLQKDIETTLHLPREKPYLRARAERTWVKLKRNQIQSLAQNLITEFMKKWSSTRIHQCWRFLSFMKNLGFHFLKNKFTMVLVPIPQDNGTLGSDFFPNKIRLEFWKSDLVPSSMFWKLKLTPQMWTFSSQTTFIFKNSSSDSFSKTESKSSFKFSWN